MTSQEWTVESRACPTKSNGFDCGVLALANVVSLLTTRSPAAEQSFRTVYSRASLSGGLTRALADQSPATQEESLSTLIAAACTAASSLLPTTSEGNSSPAIEPVSRKTEATPTPPTIYGDPEFAIFPPTHVLPPFQIIDLVTGNGYAFQDVDVSNIDWSQIKYNWVLTAPVRDRPSVRGYSLSLWDSDEEGYSVSMRLSAYRHFEQLSVDYGGKPAYKSHNAVVYYGVKYLTLRGLTSKAYQPPPSFTRPLQPNEFPRGNKKHKIDNAAPP
jgi:hypothetical protein